MDGRTSIFSPRGSWKRVLAQLAPNSAPYWASRIDYCSEGRHLMERSVRNEKPGFTDKYMF